MTAAYPELMCLVELNAAGWRWIPLLPDEIRGVRTWLDGWTDALRLRDITDAKAVRCTPMGTVVWSREGTMVDVVDGLLGLPAPSSAC